MKLRLSVGACVRAPRTQFNLPSWHWLAVAGLLGFGSGCRATRAQVPGAQTDAEVRGVSAIQVNQLGYLPQSGKVGVVAREDAVPVPWQLLNAHGTAVASGLSRPFGFDDPSGQSVHWLDFSSFAGSGSGFTLVSATSHSAPFAIEANVYDALGRDALRFFYHMRSGTPIAMPYSEQSRWAHAAGHRPDLATCGADMDCQYSLDVSGGWYDAGDQGKYVVNGGLTVWLLQNLVERDVVFGRGGALVSDGVAHVPESGNGVPDLLDEARWEMEFLLTMQVPEGEPYAGMVHHKVHDADWTALGTAPAEDLQPRVLRPPSTAATLNLAAAAAQASRLWRRYDPAFASRCRRAAVVAYRAAEVHPQRLAPPSDNRGGGAYPDEQVSDEFYWAAAELFVTTGRAEYLKDVRRSAMDGELGTSLMVDGVLTQSALTWQRVAALGQISLALSSLRRELPDGAAGNLSAAEGERYRAQILRAGEQVLAVERTQGYRVPMRPGVDGHYPWGSNADVLGNMVLLGNAGDWGSRGQFARGVASGMDYLLGRNPLGQSYVTGYGARPVRNPHHRFWAHQANSAYPPPPPGVVSGGPNSRLEDPRMRAAGLQGCPVQTCFIDHIEAYSANEVAINWNAALVWAVAWLQEADPV